jgi:hypothetical protein
MQKQVNVKYEYSATICHIYVLLIYFEYLASRYIRNFTIVET